MNAMDCTLGNLCTGCDQVFYDCGDQNGNYDPVATPLTRCMNAQCRRP
jgi:hypothetical protein